MIVLWECSTSFVFREVADIKSVLLPFAVFNIDRLWALHYFLALFTNFNPLSSLLYSNIIAWLDSSVPSGGFSSNCLTSYCLVCSNSLKENNISITINLIVISTIQIKKIKLVSFMFSLFLWFFFYFYFIWVYYFHDIVFFVNYFFWEFYMRRIECN